MQIAAFIASLPDAALDELQSGRFTITIHQPQQVICVTIRSVFARQRILHPVFGQSTQRGFKLGVVLLV